MQTKRVKSFQVEMEHAVAAFHNDACITVEIKMGYTKLYWKLECCTFKTGLTGVSDSGSKAGEMKPGESMSSCFPLACRLPLWAPCHMIPCRMIALDCLEPPSPSLSPARWRLSTTESRV